MKSPLLLIIISSLVLTLAACTDSISESADNARNAVSSAQAADNGAENNNAEAHDKNTGGENTDTVKGSDENDGGEALPADENDNADNTGSNAAVKNGNSGGTSNGNAGGSDGGNNAAADTGEHRPSANQGPEAIGYNASRINIEIVSDGEKNSYKMEDSVFNASVKGFADDVIKKYSPVDEEISDDEDGPYISLKDIDNRDIIIPRKGENYVRIDGKTYLTAGNETMGFTGYITHTVS